MSRLIVKHICKKKPNAAVKTAALGFFAFLSETQEHSDGCCEIKKNNKQIVKNN
jgi:hypothetical protein